MIVWRSIKIFVLVCALSACATNPDVPPTNPDIPLSDDIRWWSDFDDTSLNHIIYIARENAFDVRTARARVRQAQAILRAEQASLLPRLDMVGRTNVNRNAVTTVGFDMNWQLDVFGPQGATRDAANSRIYATEAAAQDVQRLITSQIVATYIQLRARQIERALSERSAIRLSDTVSKVNRLTEAGYATQLDIVRSNRQLSEVVARIDTLHGQERALQNTIRALAGHTADREIYENIVDENFVFPRPLVPPPDVDRLMVDRPDIRSALLSLDAEGFEKIAAQRSLYPSINLTAGLTTSDFNRSPLSFAGLSENLIAGFALPLLGRGRLLAQVDLETAEREEALANYEQTVLIALTEVDTALYQVAATRDAADAQRDAENAARLALSQSQRLFDAGEISFLDVLFAEQNLIDAERGAVLAEEAAALSWAQYMTALGLN